ncbi:Murein DD-endopeptidase MepM and murein hydrolase activator NlpD, contain LysM domain [Paenibacillus sp. 1_12]|uniref:M23 family metallopeptidase n=1 Tax=Paenibacillus sp. 1_12 TaxID=1566278 RepID=UPI0008E3C1EC|nr:M23 family metallopeptidase [Paenibacillus sp. 1_12]SFL11453.1 Murein DD-endopeptidase MepM and murein hydrolase activator NlpD, contain LysM domain [Paenibacillus sp. 1_12]
MKLGWGSKKFTLVIIPDANRSVRQFEMLHSIPYLAVAAVCILMLMTLALLFFQGRTAVIADQLKVRMDSQELVYNHTVEDKNETIEQLQNEVIKLSQQTTDMKARIDDIRKMEDEVRSITGSAKIAAAAEGTNGVDSAMGGISLPATNNEVKDLLSQTKTQLGDMNQELAALQQSITDTKYKALAIKEQLRVTPNIWPVDSRRITSNFGLRQDPFTRRPSFHSGYDIAAPANSEVSVTADGTVRTTGSDSERGNYIVVDHTNGLQTMYMHLNKILVQKKDSVQKGQLIGLVGSTGRSTGYHLHYEVLQNGVSIDPLPYLK